MTHRVFNFSAGPAQLPLPVMEQIQDEFLNYKGIGSSIIEISHRSSEFKQVLEECSDVFKRLVNLPRNYHVIYVHGGARMQFAAIPLNLMDRLPSGRTQYIVTGQFAKLAAKDAEAFGKVAVIQGQDFASVPSVSLDDIDQQASYVHMTANNTVFGTQWKAFPQTGDVPLVADCTSEILSRPLDYTQFGVVYAGLQKNLGPSGMAMVVIRDDLLGHCRPEAPGLLQYRRLVEDQSLTNTTNTFAIYTLGLVLKWVQSEGGVEAFEVRNQEKAQILYDFIDGSGFYLPHAAKDCRSTMNVTFKLRDESLEERFLEEAKAGGFVGLKGHRALGGM